MVRLVCLHGTGDTYLVCALARAFEGQHQVKATVVVKAGHACLPQWFGVDFEVNDAVVNLGESDKHQQMTFANEIGAGLIYVHPSFVRTPVRLDQLTVKPRVSHADMYRALLSLSPWTPLAQPASPLAQHPSEALVITAARSWPNLPHAFWIELVERLQVRGIAVTVNQFDWTLGELLERCAGTKWLIGPQCGVMAIACEAGLAGRKTIVVSEQCPDLFGLPAPMPYGHASTFAGRPHEDVHHVVAADTGAIEQIIAGPPPPKMIEMALLPSEVLDRLAVLAVKRARIPVESVEENYQRHFEAAGPLLRHSSIVKLYRMLIENHFATFDLLERAVPDALNGGMSVDDHVAAIRYNRARVELRQRIDTALGAPYSEVKSYYRSE